MKKIILIIALVIGGFTAQAQDTISVFSFKSEASSPFGNLAHAFSEDLTHCNDNVIDASSIDVYDYNNSTGVLLFNGVQSVVYSPGFAKSFIDASFAAPSNGLYSRNAFGGISGVIATTASGSSLTRN